ncbi:MAG: hypothetical protein H6553_11760 [Chitinophagales bacterium]|nr:hypothetical protein [Chitinophagales bacterium]
MKNKILIRLFGIVILFLFINGTYDGIWNSYKKWMPKDFDTKNNILLVDDIKVYDKKGNLVKSYVKANEQMREYMKEKYPYEYEFVNVDSLNLSDKYKDTDKYRYCLVWSMNTSKTYTTYKPSAPTGMQFQQNGGSAYNTFTISDRKSNTNFGTSKGTSYIIGTFSLYINTIVKYVNGELEKPE